MGNCVICNQSTGPMNYSVPGYANECVCNTCRDKILQKQSDGRDLDSTDLTKCTICNLCGIYSQEIKINIKNSDRISLCIRCIDAVDGKLPVKGMKYLDPCYICEKRMGWVDTCFSKNVYISITGFEGKPLCNECIVRVNNCHQQSDLCNFKNFHQKDSIEKDSIEKDSLK